MLDSDEVPSGPEDAAEVQAEIANLAKWRMGYRACLDVEGIDKRGLKPLLELVNEVTNILGPFDVIRPLVEEDRDASADWEGAWTDDYAIPEELLVPEQAFEQAQKMRSNVQRMRHELGTPASQDSLDLDLSEHQIAAMESRKGKVTEAVAFAHSRCEAIALREGRRADGGADLDSCRRPIWLCPRGRLVW